MAFDDLKSRVADQVHQLASRVQESSAWAKITERYEDLPPRGQKAALFGAGTLVALIVLAFPYTFYASSSSVLTDFEDRKDLIRELYRVSHDVSRLPPAPRQVDTSDLRSTAQMTATRARLQTDQIGPLMDFDNATSKPGFSPKGLSQKGLSVSYNKLNLDQVLDVGRQLQVIAPTVKMTGLRVQATTEDAHYFNVTFKLVAFALPPEPIAKSTGKKGGFMKKSGRGAGSGDE